MGLHCSKTKLNTDITSKKIKEIRTLGLLNLNPKKRSIYCIEIEFETGDKLNLRVKEEYYLHLCTFKTPINF